MPRNLSSRARTAALSLESSEAWLVLLEIHHPTITTPFRVVRNTEAVTSKGVKYYAYPFDIVLGEDDGEHLPEVSLTIDNVDRALVETIRTLAESPTVILKLVLASQPDVVELEITGLVLREVEYDAYAITGRLYADDILSMRHPADLITPASGYRGLFR